MNRAERIKFLESLMFVALGGYYNTDPVLVSRAVEEAYTAHQSFNRKHDETMRAIACDIVALTRGERGTGVSDIGMVCLSSLFD